jgi:hypothetical protein
MCKLDRKTREVTRDCGSCGCGQSSNSGNHKMRKTGEEIVVGRKTFYPKSCVKCGQRT